VPILNDLRGKSFWESLVRGTEWIEMGLDWIAAAKAEEFDGITSGINGLWMA